VGTALCEIGARFAVTTKIKFRKLNSFYEAASGNATGSEKATVGARRLRRTFGNFFTEAPENGPTETEGTGVWPAYKITKSLVCVVGTQQNNEKKSPVT
jgi:hypothetical protein